MHRALRGQNHDDTNLFGPRFCNGAGSGRLQCRYENMRVLRRTFLTTMGAAAATAFSFPAMLRAQVTASTIQRKELDMQIKRVGTQASTKGPADWFTGTVRIDPLFQANAPARAAAASVTFEPGARTAWHTHPLGQ